MNTPVKKAFDLADVTEGETIYAAFDVSGGINFKDVAVQLNDIALACIAYGVKRIIVCTFDSEVREVFDVKGNFHVLCRVKSLESGGGTVITAPLSFVRDHEDGPDGTRKVFVFTDGYFDHREIANFSFDFSFILSGAPQGGLMEKEIAVYGDVIHA